MRSAIVARVPPFFFENNQDRPRIIFADASRLVTQEAGLRNDMLIVYNCSQSRHMAKPTDLVQGTLDLLILKTIRSNLNTAGPSPSASNRFHKKLSRSSRDPCTRRYTGWNSRPGSRPSGVRLRPGEWQSSTPLHVRDGNN